MIIETRIIEAIATATACATYYGTQPQEDDGQPAPLPVIIVNRTGSRWAADFCGTDTTLSIPTIQIDVYAETAEQCRRLADKTRAAVRDMKNANGEPVAAALGSEISFYDDISRGWRIMQSWTPPDYEPAST